MLDQLSLQTGIPQRYRNRQGAIQHHRVGNADDPIYTVIPEQTPCFIVLQSLLVSVSYVHGRGVLIIEFQLVPIINHKLNTFEGLFAGSL